jgi:hypothetical protein
MALIVAAAVIAVATFVGIVVAPPSAAIPIAIVGIILTGGCLHGWGIIRRTNDR